MKPREFWPKLLRELRQESGMSTRVLSVKAGVARTSIYSAEKGERITVRTLDRLLAALGYELDAIKRNGVE